MGHRICRRHLLAALGVMATGAAAPAATPRDVADAVEIAAGQALDAAETTAIIDNATAIQRNDPRRFARNTAGLAEQLVKWRAGGDPVWRATLAERLRLAFAQFPPDAAERHMVERHDPMIAYRSAPPRLVSARTLDTLTQAALWTQATLGGPPPDVGFAALCRQTLADGFAALPDAEQDALANLRRNWEAHLELWRLANPRLRAAVITQARGGIATQADFIPAVAAMAASDWEYYVKLRQENAKVALQKYALHFEHFIFRQIIEPGIWR